MDISLIYKKAQHTEAIRDTQDTRGESIPVLQAKEVILEHLLMAIQASRVKKVGLLMK